MNHDDNHVSIYVDLDCLMDTLLGTASLCYPQILPRLIEAGYRERSHDLLSAILPSINDRVIRDRFKARDVQTLKCSYPTALLTRLGPELMRLAVEDDKTPGEKKISLTINTYPYNLTDEELAVFSESFHEILRLLDIRLIRWDVDILTPERLNDQFNHVILYDISAYLGVHYKVFSTRVMMSTVVTFALRPVEGKEKEPMGDAVELAHGFFCEFCRPDLLALADISVGDLPKVVQE